MSSQLDRPGPALAAVLDMPVDHLSNRLGVDAQGVMASPPAATVQALEAEIRKLRRLLELERAKLAAAEEQLSILILPDDLSQMTDRQ